MQHRIIHSPQLGNPFKSWLNEHTSLEIPVLSGTDFVYLLRPFSTWFSIFIPFWMSPVYDTMSFKLIRNNLLGTGASAEIAIPGLISFFICHLLTSLSWNEKSQPDGWLHRECSSCQNLI